MDYPLVRDHWRLLIFIRVSHSGYFLFTDFAFSAFTPSVLLREKNRNTRTSPWPLSLGPFSPLMPVILRLDLRGSGLSLIVTFFSL